jgi:hypothetical protein
MDATGSNMFRQCSSVTEFYPVVVVLQDGAALAGVILLLEALYFHRSVIEFQPHYRCSKSTVICDKDSVQISHRTQYASIKDNKWFDTCLNCKCIQIESGQIFTKKFVRHYWRQLLMNYAWPSIYVCVDNNRIR